MKTLNPKAPERGFILIAVYMVVIFVSLFSIVFFARHHASIQATERYQNRVLAFNAAESGIDYAMRKLAVDATFRGNPPAVTPTTPYYTSTVTSMSHNAFSFTLSYVPNQTSLRRIDATGCTPTCNATERDHQSAAITVYAAITTPAIPSSLFEYGIYTTSTINLSGSSFDSYNSSQGAYGGSNVSTAGAIAANTNVINGIAVANSTVKGSILVKENATPNTVIKVTNSTITGTKGNLPSGWTLPAPTSMADLTTPPTVVDLSNVTHDVTLAAGTYQATQIKIAGQGQIITTGAVVLYVAGGIDITGQGTTTALNKPGNLQIYATGTSSVKIAGNGSFYGAVYAPNSDVTFQTSNSGKGGTFFGAVIGKTFSTSGGGVPTVHYDLALKANQPVDPNQTNIVRVKAWQEMNSLAWGTGS